MAYRVGRKEDVAAALVRLVRGDLDDALADLAGDEPTEARVHRIRQHLKRVRTLLRVLEPMFGNGARAARGETAATARLLAGARDAGVAAASARDLAAATAASDQDVGFDLVAEALDREAADHQEEMLLDEVGRRLAATRAAVAGFGVTFEGSALLDAALRRAYRRGRRTMRWARISLATPDLH
ncbi:MAG: CHAD domain-containing protein, partial [Bauldia sp.]